MYKIEKITKIKKKGMYKIHFDNHEALQVHEDVLLSNELLIKKNLTEEDILILENSTNYSRCYHEAIKFISRKLRSSYELKKHLIKKEFEISTVDEIIEKLISQKYIDDLNYAKSYANTILRTTNKGKDYIRKNLKEHKISDIYVDEAIMMLDDKEEYDKLYKLITKKISLNNKYSARVLREKLFYDLKTKGYTTQMINQVFSEVEFTCNIEHLKVLAQKYMRKYNDKSKVKKTLISKGFESDEIDKVL